MHVLIFKFLNFRVTFKIWQIALFFFFILSIIAYRKINHKISLRNKNKELAKYEEVIVEHEKYITNISFKYIEKELENFYDHKIPEEDIAKLNDLISNIIND